MKKKDKLDEINEKLAGDLVERMNKLFDMAFEKAENYIKSADSQELAQKLIPQGAKKEPEAFCGIMCESCTIAKSAEK